MIEVQNRINEILSRMGEINNKLNRNAENTNSFKETLAEMQERIYYDRLDLNEASKYNTMIEESAKKYFLPEKLIKSVIKQESNFNPKAVSPKGAKGLMQLMPPTADLLGVKDIYNPRENIEAGVKYLRMMLNKFDGDLIKALAAYNAGPEAVEKYNGVPDYQETKDYIKNIIKNLESF